jgi:Glycine rich protein
LAQTLRALSNPRSRRARWTLGLSALCAVAAPLAWAAAPAQAITENFAYTGGEQMFVVPTGVYEVQVLAIGGQGGESNGPAGGEAAEVKGAMDVTPGQTLYVEVGGKGQTGAEGGAGGFNGGAGGGGGGGGASDIRTVPRSTSLTVEDTRLLVAAGGGGGGSSSEEPGGAGGAAGSPGGTSNYLGGGAGTESEGGAGASGCEASGTGGNGELGAGGAGGNSFVFTGPGGGGGGGFYGGGGGGGACAVGSSGGGGGSSLVPPLALLTLSSAAPKIEISYHPPPSVEIVFPAEGGTYSRNQIVSANYSCLPGEGATLKSCVGPVANGAPLNTSTAGEHTFTVNGEDTDKGKASKGVTYTVYPPPAVEVGSPAEGATYTQGQTVTAAYVCLPAEGLGLESCAGPVASGAAIDTATPGPHNFTVEAEDSIGGATSRKIGYTVAAPPGPAPPGPAPASAADTTLGSHPKTTIKTKKNKVKVKFSFSSDVTGATFMCMLDKGAFAPCTSPKSYSVKKGKHTFSVEAVGPGGTDASPATFSFKVKKKK